MVAGAQGGADVGSLAELAQVLTRAEATPRAGEDDRADLRIARLLDGVEQQALRLPVERVEDVRPVQRDRLDGARSRQLDLGHGRTA